IFDVVMLVIPFVSAPGELADERRRAALAQEEQGEGGGADDAAVEVVAVPGAILLLLVDKEFAAFAVPVAVGHEAVAGKAPGPLRELRIFIKVQDDAPGLVGDLDASLLAGVQAQQGVLSVREVAAAVDRAVAPAEEIVALDRAEKPGDVALNPRLVGGVIDF